MKNKIVCFILIIAFIKINTYLFSQNPPFNGLGDGTASAPFQF